jgi:uncharacterized protein (DUF2141 family)
MRKPIAIVFALLASLSSVQAQTPAEAEAPASELTVELNALQDAQGNCRVTFLATNGFDVSLQRASLETAFFDASGTIDRIVTLDFEELSPGKTKVLQFQLAGLDCTRVGRVLINDITACEGEGLAPDACLAALVTTVRPDISFGA